MDHLEDIATQPVNIATQSSELPTDILQHELHEATEFAS